MLKSRLTALVVFVVTALALQAAPASAKPVLQWAQPQQIAATLPPSAFSEDAADISCAGSSLCVAVGGEGKSLSSTDPTGGIDAWSEAQLDVSEPPDLAAVSCPTTGFCAAVGADGNLWVSHEPALGTWTATLIAAGHSMTEISCPSSTFCTAGDALGNVFVSDDPEGGAGTWEETEIEAGEEVISISCPSSSLCVVVTEGDVFASSDPLTGGWSGAGIAGFWDVSCSSASFCAASSLHGVFVSDEPQGGAGAWSESPGSPTSWGSISCSSETFCATADYSARVSTSGDPAGADPEWDESALRSPANLQGLSCTSSDLCVAILSSGAVLTSTDPAGGVDAWDYTATDGDPALRSVDCPAPTLCLAAGPHGTLYTSTEPTVPGSWTGDRITDGELQQVECKTVDWCFARAYNRTLLYSTDPTGGPGAWDSVSMPFVLDAACPESFFCAGVDGSGSVLLSSEPLAGAETWTALDMELPDWRLGPNQLRQVTCPFWGLCAVGGDVGTVLTSSNPTGGKAAWFESFVGNPDDFYNGAGPSVDALDCPAWWFCAAAMWSGTISTTLDPPNPPVPWSFKSTEANFLDAISCSYEGGLCVGVSDWGWAISALDGTSGDPTWSELELFDHEGLEEVSCAPEDAFCLVADDQGYGTIGTVVDDGSTEPADSPSVIPAGPGNPTPKKPCRKKSKGSRAGKLAIGGAVPLSSAGKRSRTRCSRPA